MKSLNFSALLLASVASAGFIENLNDTLKFYYEKKINETASERPMTLRAGGKPGFPKLDYGCYCKHISRRGIFQANEPPSHKATGPTNGLDAIDAICKTVMNGWACLASSGCDLETQTFVQPSFFGFRYKLLQRKLF